LAGSAVSLHHLRTGYDADRWPVRVAEGGNHGAPGADNRHLATNLLRLKR
jgi:hypothetical protein